MSTRKRLRKCVASDESSTTIIGTEPPIDRRHRTQHVQTAMEWRYKKKKPHTLSLIAVSLLLLALQWRTFTSFHHRTSSTRSSIPELAPDHAHTQRLYYRYDEAGIQPLPGTARSHRLPNAVPPSRTVPRHMGSNRTYLLSQRSNTSAPSLLQPPRKFGTYNPDHEYATDYRPLYLYNPSVLPLHNTIEHVRSTDADPDWLSPDALGSA